MTNLKIVNYILLGLLKQTLLGKSSWMIEGIDNLLNQGKVPKIPREGGLPLIGRGGATNFGQKWEVEKTYFVQEWRGMKFLP